MSLLDKSLAISRELGMEALMEQVVSRQEILETPKCPRTLLPVPDPVSYTHLTLPTKA